MFPLKDDIPSRRWPIVTVGLIASCVLIFWWQASLGARAGTYAVYSYGFIPAVLLGDAELPAELAVLPPFATLFTSMFLHGGLMHLAGNMIYLWVFGNNIEDNLGHARFLVFYLLCGIAAAFAQALPDPTSEIPMIGASGAISGVLGAYLILFPHARVHVIIPFGFMFLHTIRAGWLLGLWLVFQLLSGVFGDFEPGRRGVLGACRRLRRRHGADPRDARPQPPAVARPARPRPLLSAAREPPPAGPLGLSRIPATAHRRKR